MEIIYEKSLKDYMEKKRIAAIIIDAYAPHS